jgi:uracil-DNA glycosylase
MSPKPERSMRWSERQRAMLREMGVQLWSPRDAAESGTAALSEAGEAARAIATGDAPTPTPARTDAMARAAPAAAGAPGLAPADWLVVGEPLDAADPQQAQLLDNMLRAIGVARAAPARERRAAFVALVAGDEREALAAAIATVAPRCILALGRAAAAAVLGSDAPLSHWRGRLHERAALSVVVSFPLAFLLRNPAEKAKAWADLCLAVAAVAAPVG